jgi:CBS domain-containing protein
MRLDSAFPKRVVTAEPDCHLTQIAELMEEHAVGTVVIVEADRPVGIVTDRDLALELGSGRVTRSEAVRAIMTHPVATIGCHEGILAATRRLHDNAVRRLPIVDDAGRLVGLVGTDDLFILLGRELGNLAGGVRQEVAAAKFAAAATEG